MSPVFVLHQVVQVIFQQIKRLPKVHIPKTIWNFKHFFVFQDWSLIAAWPSNTDQSPVPWTQGPINHAMVLGTLFRGPPAVQLYMSSMVIYKITRILRMLWMDEPLFLSEYRDTNDVTKTRENFGYFIKQIGNSFHVCTVIETWMTPFQQKNPQKTLGYALCFH